MTEKITLEITNETGRIDAVLAKKSLPYSRTVLAEWLQDGHIVVNQTQVKRSYKVNSGDLITILPPAVQNTEIIAENMPLDIVYEDNDLLVVNKPQGMVVHPAAKRCLNNSRPIKTNVSIMHWSGVNSLKIQAQLMRR